MNLFKRADLANSVVKAHNDGKNYIEIGSELGVSSNQVRYFLKHAREAGITVIKQQRGRKSSPATAERRALIAEHYLAGDSGPTISRKLGVTLETVYSNLRIAGVKARVRGDAVRNQTIVVRYQAGESGVKIAQDIGVTPKVIYDALHRAGVLIRKKQATATV